MKHTNNYFYVKCNGDKKQQQHAHWGKKYRDQSKFTDNSPTIQHFMHIECEISLKKEVCGVIKLIGIRQTSGYFSKYSK